MKTMRRPVVLAVILVAFIATGAAIADHHVVKITSKDGVGKYLTDAKGMTLYIFKMDSPGKSACGGPCVENWPLYYQETVEAAAGLTAGEFGVVTRGDGRKQTTYKGMPLYYFAGDKKPGDMNGQGLKEAWYAAAP
ncbi:MAG TPA: hypothetical protein VN604_09755 [Nitrospirota bacterium]|nr:hypothetical protein [Nitrospirota bacterium]